MKFLRVKKNAFGLRSVVLVMLMSFAIAAMSVGLAGALARSPLQAIAADEQKGTQTLVYLGGASANDNNEGSSADKAVATFAKAKELVARGNSLIYIVGEVAVTGDESWSLPTADFGNVKIARHSSYAGALVRVASGAKLELSDIVIDGMMIEGSSDNTGALVHAEGGTLDVKSGAYLQYNHIATDSLSAGAIDAKGASVVNIGVGAVIRGNAAAYGGGINGGGTSTVNLSGGTVRDNIASVHGGGIYLSDSATMTMTSGTVESNSAARYGGGLAVSSSATAQISGGVFSNNSTTVDNTNAGGGAIAIYESNAQMSIANATFENNSTAFRGGAVFILAAKNQVSVTDCVFQGNFCETGGTFNHLGGAIFHASQDLTIVDTSFVRNRASQGGAIYHASNGTLTLTGTKSTAVFSGNFLQHFSQYTTDFAGIDILAENSLNVSGYRFENSDRSVVFGGLNNSKSTNRCASLYAMGITSISNCNFVGSNAYKGIKFYESFTMETTTITGFQSLAIETVTAGGTCTIKNSVIGNENLSAETSDRNGFGIDIRRGMTLIVTNSKIINSIAQGIRGLDVGVAVTLDNSSVTNNGSVGIHLLYENSKLLLKGAETRVENNYKGATLEVSYNIQLAKVNSYIQVEGTLGAEAKFDFSLSGALGALSVAPLRIPTNLLLSEGNKFVFLPKVSDGSDGSLKVTQTTYTEGDYTVFKYTGYEKLLLSTVYVSQTGSDETGDGSSALPFKTITKAKEYRVSNTSEIIPLSNLTIDYDCDLSNVVINTGYWLIVVKNGVMTLNNTTFVKIGTGATSVRHVSVEGGVVNITGHVRYGGSQTSVGFAGFLYMKSGEMNFYDGAYFSFRPTNAYYGQSQIIALDGGVFNIYGGRLPQLNLNAYVANGTGDQTGIYIGGTGVVNMSGGTYDHMGLSTRMPVYGVIVAGGGTFNMSGGTLMGNNSTFDGAAVWVRGGTFNMSGGVIQNNASANKLAAGVRVDNGTFNISGSAQVISTNSCVQIGGNNSAAMRIIGDLDASARFTLAPNVTSLDGATVVVNTGNFNVSLDNFIKSGDYEGAWFLDSSKSLIAPYVARQYIYVSSTGNDTTNDGGESAPVRSLSRAMQLVAEGGTIYLVGTYFPISSEKVASTYTYNGVQITKRDVTIRPMRGSVFGSSLMINVNRGSLTIDGLNIDGSNESVKMSVLFGASLTIKNSTIYGLNIVGSGYIDAASGNHYLTHSLFFAEGNLTLEQVTMRDNVGQTLIAAYNFDSITLHDVDMSGNAVKEDYSILLLNTAKNCTFNLGGKVVFHETGLMYDTEIPGAKQGTLTIDRSLSADSRIILRTINPEANNLVAQTSGNGITANGTCFSLRTPAYTFEKFDGNGKLFVTPSIFKRDKVYLNSVSGSDMRDGASVSTAVKTLSRAMEIVNDYGEIYLTSTYNVVGTIMNREEIVGKGVKIIAAFSSKSLIYVPQNGYLALSGITLVGGANMIQVASGGYLRFKSGSALSGFTGTNAIVTSGNLIIDTLDVSDVGLSKNRAIISSTGGEINVNSGTFSDTAKKWTLFGVRDGKLNLNGGTFRGFAKMIDASGSAEVNVLSGVFADNGSADGGFLTVSGGNVKMYGGTVTGSSYAPVLLTGGSFHIIGGSISVGESTGSAIVAENSATLFISNGTVSATKGRAVTAAAGVTVTVSGAPALSGILALAAPLVADGYTGGLQLSIFRTDAIVSQMTAIVTGNVSVAQFALVNGLGQPIEYYLRAKSGDLFAYAKWTVSFDLNGGLFNGGAVAPVARNYYDGDAYSTQGALPTGLSRAGYTFAGWSLTPDGALVANDSLVSSSHRLYAIWTPNNNTPYLVEYYLQNLNGIGYTKFSTENKTGTTASTVNVPGDYLLKFNGFSFADGYSANVLSATLAPGGTVLKVYYTRNTYTINIHLNDNDASTEVITGLYETNVTAPVLTRNGYAFVGFYADPDLTVSYAFTVMPLNGTDIYVKWTAKTYILSFNLAGGSYTGSLTKSVVFDQSVTGLVTDDTLLTKKGYEFQYWTIDGVRFNENDPWIYPSNKTATAVWRPSGKTAYLVEHYLEDASGAFALDFTESKFGLTDSVVTTVDRFYTGFGFDADNADNVVSGTISADGKLVLKLYYKRNAHTVTFETFGGSAVASQTVKYGLHIPRITGATKTGYTLKGWYVGADKDVLWDFSAETMPDSDVVLKANWIANLYTIVYNGNGNDSGIDMNTQTFLYDSGNKSLLPNTYYRTGYRFLGWSKQPSGTAEYLDGDVVPSNLTSVNGGTITLYAVWSANSYTVLYNKNDILATGAMPETSFVYGVGQKLSANVFAKAGYTFQGWALTSTGNVRYEDADTVNNLTSAQNGRVTLYAKWAPNESTGYHILFYKQNADDSRYTLESTLSSNGTTDTVASYRNDTIFGDGFKFNEQISVISGTITADGSLELKLYYDRAKFNLEFDSDGGSAVASQIVKNGAKLTAPVAPVLFGFTFLYWYAEGDTTAPYVFDTMPSKNVALKALWKNNVFQVVFDGNNATFGEMEQLAVTYLAGGTISLTANVYQRTGYTFAGWNTGVRGDGIAFADGSSFKTDYVSADGAVVTLYAQWSINSYTVTYDAGAGMTSPDAVTKPYASKLTKPADPVKKGYTFDGWYNNGVKWSFGNDTVPGMNITLSARYNAAVYKINWYLNGGDYSGTLPESYTIEDEEIVFSTSAISKRGNTFIKWTFDSVSGETATGVAAGSTGDRYVYAVWKPNEYTMSFETYGGSSIASVTVTFATKIDKPVDPVKAGYVFSGWYKSLPAGDGWSLTPDWNVPWDFNSDTVPAPGMTLHAKWEANVYDIVYDLSGGVFAGNPYPASYKITDADILFNNALQPTRTGYHFLGWNPEKIESGSFGKKTVVAQWELNSYSVAFVSGGSAVDPVTVNFGALISEPDVPVKTGYRFIDWYKDASFAAVWDFDLDKMPARDVTLYGRWEKDSFTITFDTNGGNAVASVTTEYEATVTAPADAVRKGYTFGGWFKDESLSNAYTFGKMPAENFTLYAKWHIVDYTIAYELGGGAFVGGVNPNQTQYTVEDAFDIFGTLTGRTGYTFKGWLPASIDIGTTGNLTVTAVWEANTYMLSFELNGGTGDASPLRTSFGAKIGAMPLPVRAGYQFDGWYNDTQKYTADTVWNFTENKTVVAKWVANPVNYSVEYYCENPDDDEYSLVGTDTLQGTTGTMTALSGYLGRYANFTFHAQLSTVEAEILGDGSTVLKIYYTRDTFDMTFDANGGSAVASRNGVKHGASISAPAVPTRAGYTFGGWMVGGSAYTFTVMPSADVALTAEWAAVTYQIVFMANGGSLADGQTYVTEYTIENSVVLPQLKRNNYMFSGWYDNADFAGNAVTVIDVGTFGDKTYYAKWDIDQSVIGFNSNGGSAVDVIQSAVGSPITAPEPPTRLGYKFDGWYEDNVTFEMEFVFSTMPVDGLMLYAKWIAHTYTVLFDANGGTGADMAAIEMVYGTAKTLPLSAFGKMGYTFAGWNTMQNGTGVAYSDGAIVNSLTATDGDAVTLYAQWTANAYTVKFYKNGASATGNMPDAVFVYDAAGNLTANGYVRMGYTYLGWNTQADGNGTSYADQASVLNLLSVKDGVMNLYAVWKANTYQLTLDANGGSAASAQLGMTFDAAIGQLPVPTRAGYDFGGWTVDGNAISEGKVWNYDSDRTAVAQWTARTDTPYRVEYYANDSDGSYSIYLADDLTGVTDTLVVLTDYETKFNGMIYRADGSSVSGTITGDGELVLKVYYNRNISKLSYIDENGVTQVIVAAGTFGDAITAPAVAKVGYTFAGFYNVDNHAPFDFATGMPGSDTVLGLSFTANVYEVVFDKNDSAASGTMSAKLYTYDAAAEALTKNTFAKTGYTFAGWNTLPGGEGVSYRDTESVRNLSTEPNGNVTLYAVWRANQYKLTLMDDVNTISEITVYYGSAIGQLPVISKAGYKFGNWVINGTVITETTVYQYTGHRTAEAQWTAQTYDITYVSSVADYVNPNRTSYAFEDMTVALADASKVGYEFCGWYGDAAFANRISSFATDTEGKTVYAKWALDEANGAEISTNAFENSYDPSITYSLTAAATHAAAGITYRYQWYKDGVAIAGETSATLEIRNVADSGVYTVKVWAIDSVAALESANGTLTAAKTFTITKATFDMSGTSWDYTNEFIYDGQEKTVSVTGLPNGLTVKSYTNHTYTNAGIYTATVTFEYDTDNYELPVFAELTWTIAQSEVVAPDIETKVYTGERLTADVAESGLYTVKENAGGTETGEYDVVVSLKDAENYRWQNSDSADKALTFVIKQADNAISELTLEGWTYNQLPNAASAKSIFGSIVYSYSATENGNYTEAVPTDAGTYYVKASVAETNNFKGAEATLSFVIQKADYDMSGITLTGARYEYDGGEHYPVISGTLPTGADGVTVTVTYAGFAKDVSDGRVTVTATFASASGNYNVPAALSAYAEITVKHVSVTWTNDARYVYDGTARSVSAYYTDIRHGEIALTVTEKGGKSFVNAGKYVFVASGTDANYELTGIEITLTMEKREVAKASLEADDLVYTGAALEAKLTESELYAAASNIGTNAGRYTAQVSLKDTSNNKWAGDSDETESAALEIEWHIANAKITVSGVTAYEGEYDGNEHGLTAEASVTTVGGMVAAWTYGTSAGAYTENQAPRYVNADEYTVYYKVSASNHDDYTGSYTVKITPAQLSDISVKGYEGAYDTLEHAAVDGLPFVTTVNGMQAVWTYSTDENGTFTETVPMMKGAGSYTVYYRITADNHTSESGSFAVVIAKAALNASVTLENWTYGASANTPELNAPEGAGTASYRYAGTSNGNVIYDAESAPALAGAYDLTVTFAESDNYLAGSASVSFIIARAAASIDTSGVKIVYEYDGSEQSVSVGAILNHNETEPVYANNTFTTVADGNGKVVKISAAQTDNYEAADAEVTLTVNRKTAAKPSADTAAYTYNGLSQSYKPEGYDASIMTIEGESQSTANETGYTVTVRLRDAENYRWADGDAEDVVFTFVILKKTLNITADDFEVAYGDEMPKFTVAYEGFVADEGASDLEGSLKFNCSYAVGSEVGTYGVKAEGLTSENYRIVFVEGMVKVAAAKVAVEWSDSKFVYDGTDRFDAVTAYYTDINGGQIALKRSVEGGSFKDWQENGYKFTAAFATEEEAKNYAFSEGENKVYTIDKRAVSVIADDASMVKGSEPPQLTWSYAEGSAEFVETDEIALSMTTNATKESAVGKNYYTQIEPLDNLNYDVTCVKGVMTVTECVLIAGEDSSLVFATQVDGVLVEGEHNAYDENNPSYLTNLTEKQKLESVLAQFGNDRNSIKVYNSSGAEVSDTSLAIGTGWKICLVDANGDIVDQVTAIIKGDLTGDGALNSIDKAFLQRYVASAEQFGVCQLLAADLNGDGKINSLDKAMLQRHIAGLGNIFAPAAKEIAAGSAEAAVTKESKELRTEEIVTESELQETEIDTGVSDSDSAESVNAEQKDSETAPEHTRAAERGSADGYPAHQDYDTDTQEKKLAYSELVSTAAKRRMDAQYA